MKGGSEMDGRHSKERTSEGGDSEERREDKIARQPVWLNSWVVDKICWEERLVCFISPLHVCLLKIRCVYVSV